MSDLHVVTLCTGNAARSVMAGCILREHVPGLKVTTSGTHVIEGMPMSWRTRDAISSLGLEIPDHRSRQATQQELDSADLAYIPKLDPEPDGGVNVEPVVPNDPLVSDGVGRIRMRVHERGSGETLSCGTGAVAAALATRHWAGSGAPDQWRVEVPGGSLGVRMWPAEDGEHVSLSGPAELVYDGVWRY